MRLEHQRLTRARIYPEAILAEVSASSAGGAALFVGMVRDNSEFGRVDLISYEAYEPMAEKRLRQIEGELRSTWPECKVSLRHRIGELKVGEVSVAVAVSAPHRARAFEACRYAIERIKHEVPIWKKERLADGSERWVEGSRTAVPSEDVSSPIRGRS